MLRQSGLIFEWDEAKSEKNLAERGFDFEYACRIFGGDIIEWDDTRRDLRRATCDRDRRGRRGSLCRRVYATQTRPPNHLGATRVKEGT